MTDHIIVLASGRGTRAGGPKALHKVGSEHWWQIQARRLARTGLPTRWVVSESVAREMSDHDVLMIPGDDTAPMFASILAGVERIHAEDKSQNARGVFILPVDVPAPNPKTFSRLSEAMAAAHKSINAAVPTHAGKHGHPIYLPWRSVQAHLLGRAPNSDDRLDRLIETSRLEVPVDDPGVLLNLNTAESFEAFAHRELGLTRP